MEVKEDPTERQSSTRTKRQSFLPLSFRRPALVCTVTTTFLFLGVTGFVHFRGARDGAVFVGYDGDGLSVGQLFQVRYLPIILTVLYGSWITVLDLDVKRLEPWLQLSLHSTTSSASSLLCRYDTEFILSVLAKSLLSRHWTVFASTWLAILATMILPAVQNSIISVRKQAAYRTLPVSQPQSLATLDSQTALMSNNFLLSAYATTWLGQSSPAFSTNQYALAPFRISSPLVDTHGQNEGVLTAPTIRYWVELSCWSPSLITTNLTESLVSFNDGQGCDAANLLSYNATTTSMYDQSAEYEAYLFSSSSLGWNPYLPDLKTACPGHPHLLLATWRRAGSNLPDFAKNGNATAMFCQAQYYHEPVNATLQMSDFSVVSYVATGPQSELPDTVFNRTQFEYIATSGAPPAEDTTKNLTLIVDVADASYVAQKTRIQNMSVVTPDQQSNDVLIGFALGLTRLPAEDYLSFEALSSAYNSAFQLLFVHAIRYTFSANTEQGFGTDSILATSTNQSSSAIWTILEESAVVVSGFAIATEALLTAMCIICIFILISIPRRPLSLNRNPDSLAGVMFLARAAGLQRFFSHWDSASEDALQEALQDEAFDLEDDENGPLLKRAETGLDAEIHKTQSLDLVTNAHHRPSQSLELSWSVSGAVTLLLSGGICLLIVLSALTQRKNGVEMPLASDFVQQALLNFLPTAAATLLSMYLTLLCRLYAFLKPMHDLARGNADARSTLLVRYTSFPPQLLFIEAFYAKHYLLGLMSIATVLSSVLTVTAASMFVLQQTDIALTTQSAVLYEPYIPTNSTEAADALIGRLPGSSASDAIYATLANLSDLTPLPSWTTDSYGFLPVGLAGEVRGQPVSSYQFQSLGYGAELQCFDLQKAAGDFAGNIVFQNNGTTFQVWANFTTDSGSRTECVFDSEYDNSIDRLNLAQLPTSTAALEISNVMSRWNGSVPVVDEFCATQIVKGWVRASRVMNATDPGAFAMDYNATIILCQPQLMTRSAELETTPSGNILSSRYLSDVDYDLPPTVSLSTSLTTVLVITRDYYTVPEWHNDTIARDWSNYMYHTYTGNRDFLNASLPPPGVELASQVVSNMFRRLFAVQLFLDRDQLQPVMSTSANTTLQAHEVSLSNTNTTAEQTANAIVPVQRLFMSKINSAISITILVFDLIILITFRFTLPKPFLPRMPFTIASQIAFFSGSHVIDDVVKAGGNLKDLDEKGYRYAYGKYIGRDGWLHTGIEREQFVTKL